jgi:Fe-S oxidoreductase
MGAAHPPHTLFWPGCALSSYSRELTEAVFAFLRERDLADGMSVRCCGNVIRYTGDATACATYQEALVVELKARGIRRVITACPNCHRSFENMLGCVPGIELCALSRLLADEGLRVLPERLAPTTTVCIHDSCPDRGEGLDAAAVRELFGDGGIELREMEHNRSRSRCCGLGCLRFVSDPEASQRQREQRIAEFGATGAEQLVTYCFSCANAFQDPARDLAALHYLELLFDIRIDWPAVYKSSTQALAHF